MSLFDRAHTTSKGPLNGCVCVQCEFVESVHNNITTYNLQFTDAIETLQELAITCSRKYKSHTSSRSHSIFLQKKEKILGNSIKIFTSFKTGY